MKLLFLDTETGGLESFYSLLSINLLFCEVTLKEVRKIASLNLIVKPNDDIYTVNPTALSINRIDLIQHQKEAITYKEANKSIEEFLSSLYKKHGRIILAGKNIQFDLDQMFLDQSIDRKVWDKYTDRNALEIQSIARLAMICGVIPENQSISLSSLASFLKVPTNESLLHTAEYDNILAASVLLSLLNLMGLSK